MINKQRKNIIKLKEKRKRHAMKKNEQNQVDTIEDP